MADDTTETSAGPENTQTTAPNPTTHRTIEGHDHSFVIPRNQAGVPLTEFFANAPLPEDLSNAVVYKTEQGHVLAPPDPVVWERKDEMKAEEYAEALEKQINVMGRYRPSLDAYKTRLSAETGHDLKEAERKIAEKFQQQTGKTPGKYLEAQRIERNLPVGRTGYSHKRGPSQGR